MTASRSFFVLNDCVSAEAIKWLRNHSFYDNVYITIQIFFHGFRPVAHFLTTSARGNYINFALWSYVAQPRLRESSPGKIKVTDSQNIRILGSWKGWSVQLQHKGSYQIPHLSRVVSHLSMTEKLKSTSRVIKKQCKISFFLLVFLWRKIYVFRKVVLSKYRSALKYKSLKSDKSN